jgi:hypothetical protein
MQEIASVLFLCVLSASSLTKNSTYVADQLENGSGTLVVRLEVEGSIQLSEYNGDHISIVVMEQKAAAMDADLVKVQFSQKPGYVELLVQPLQSTPTSGRASISTAASSCLILLCIALSFGTTLRGRAGFYLLVLIGLWSFISFASSSNHVQVDIVVYVPRGFILSKVSLTASKGTVRVDTRAITSSSVFNCTAGPDQDMCPLCCGGHGECSNGSCICDNGFQGHSCSNQTKTTFVLHSNPDDPVLLEATTPDGERIVLVGEKDDNGRPQKADFFHIIDRDGKITDVHLEDDGLPGRAVDESGARIDFIWDDNITSVHLIAVSGGGESQVSINIDLESANESLTNDLRKRRDASRHTNWGDSNSEADIIRSGARYNRQVTQDHVAVATINVTTCGIPESDTSVGAEVSVGFVETTKRYTSVSQLIGKETETEGVYIMKIPLQPTIQRPDTCKAVNNFVRGICRSQNTQAMGNMKEISTTICLELQFPLHLRQKGTISNLCKNAFKGYNVYCNQFDNSNGEDSSKENDQSKGLCDVVTGITDSALGLQAGVTVLVRPYAVFGSSGKVFAENRTVELAPGSVGEFEVANPMDSPVVESLVVTPVDPAPGESYVVMTTYRCVSPTTNITMHIIGTDEYEKTETCFGGRSCILYVPGAEALVEDNVTVSIYAEPGYRFQRKVRIIF